MTTQVERNSLWPNHLPSVQLKKGRTFNRHALPTLNISINIPREELLNQHFLATDDVHTLLYAAQALTLQVVDSILFLQ